MTEENKTTDENIEIFESLVIKSGDVSISIQGDPSGTLAGKTADQMILICADILRRSAGEGMLEETLQIPEAIKETLAQNYGWTDIEINTFVKYWRKNLYLMKIGKDNGVSVDLEEYNRFVTYLEKKKAKDLDEISPTGDGTLEDEFVASIEEREMTTEEKPVEIKIKKEDLGNTSIVDGVIAEPVQNLSDLMSGNEEKPKNKLKKSKN